jgi:hypothetical protein
VPAAEPLQEFNFYDGYRIRLEAKLTQKNRQITRDEHLLKTHEDQGNDALQASLRQAREEREELKVLIEQVRERLEKFKKKE